MNVQFPRIFRPFFGKTIWRKTPSEKVIYLTFDDGPVPEVTPQVLDILDQYNWKATFFCVGENVQKYPGLYHEVLQRGHKTGNHSFNHLKGFNHTTGGYVDNVNKASEYIDSKLFRPPYGRITKQQINVLKDKYQIVMWDLITYDYDKNLSAEQVFGNVKRNLRKGSIVVFHDSVKAKENVLTVLPKAIEFWEKKGYRFGVL
ncbi:MAG: polysaccharide deacetylase family protein [Bacteroidales bacterium]|nr:polysaccharide deacetylase family protein [Bacteroidales bacterium]